MSSNSHKISLASSDDCSKPSGRTFYVAVAELVHERDVLLKALGDAAENYAKLRQERDRLKAQLAQ